MQLTVVHAGLAIVLLGCAQAPAPPPTSNDVPLFGDGYRSVGDPCRIAGESAYTNRFLDDAAHLVACPEAQDLDAFVAETGGQEVGRRDGFVLFSVSYR